MAGTSLLTLLDDIATLLDDVAVMTKVAARKTAGVLGDDLALNAEQVTGVRASRELPVVWAVFKGSARNKAILVPTALLISAVLPQLITPLLMLGGAFLCFEGFEKVAHKWLEPEAEREQHHSEQLQANCDPQVDMVAFEQEKIKGAIRTDFILSAEIIVIALGTVKAMNLPTQVGVLVTIAILMTIGVYGLVAAIVRMDDVGIAWTADAGTSALASVKRAVGGGLLSFAPHLMKTLTVVGTAAMFLVGGGILMHGIPGGEALTHAAEAFGQTFTVLPQLIGGLAGMLINGIGGLLAGAILVALMTAFNNMRGKSAH